MGLEPGTLIGYVRKGNCMGLAEPKGCKGRHLPEYLLCKLCTVALPYRSIHKLCLKPGHFFRRAVFGHGPAKGIGHGVGKTCKDMDHAKHLFLEDYNAVGLLKHGPQVRMEKFYGLTPILPGYISPHHVALYRSGPEKGYLCHDIREFSGLEPSQEMTLARGFQLKDPKALSTLKKGIGGAIIKGELCKVHIYSLLPQDFLCLAKSRVHP